MKTLIKLLLTALAVIILGYLLPRVAVTSFFTAFIVAIVLALLNAFLKPILVFLTIPATILTLGLFLLIINAVIILIGDYFVDGFSVSGFWAALLFSIILSVCQSILNGIFIEKD